MNTIAFLHCSTMVVMVTVERLCVPAYNDKASQMHTPKAASDFLRNKSPIGWDSNPLPDAMVS